MIRLLIVLIVIIAILIIFRNTRKNINKGIYKNIILILIVVGVLFFLATSGKFILPQILQILKVGLPFLTKFIGI